MRRWTGEQLDQLRAYGTVVVLDPESLLDREDRERLSGLGQPEEVGDWFDLRRVYERFGRNRDSSAKPLVILMQSPEFQSVRDLPFDIEQQTNVLRIHLPVPAPLAAVVRSLPGDLQDRAVASLRNSPPDPFGALLGAAWGVSLPPRSASEVQELEAMVRLRSDNSVPPTLWEQVRPRLSSPIALSLAQEPPEFHGLQMAWADWLRSGGKGAWAATFERIGPRLATLFHFGFLQPEAATAGGLPAWANVGIRDRSPKERVEALLELNREKSLPSDPQAWIQAAEWWGEVRAGIGLAAPHAADLATQCWPLWEQLDTAFGGWLRTGYGSLMFSAATWPSTVDRIAGFMARRLRQGLARRILLVVLDGMAFAQWSVIRSESGLRTLSSGGVFAMVPTLTSISRQAILAGQPPSSFPQTIRTSAYEERAWSTFWAENGLSGPDVRYYHTVGRSPSDVPSFGLERIAGCVVTAVDDILPGAELLGDPQVLAAVVLWVRHGFLMSLVEQATASGFEVWLTSDHGNLESLPLGRVHEGLALESAGLRVRLYADPALRDNASAEGLAWDPPGLPSGTIYPLFAPGRGGYFAGSTRVTHGGLSLDEVIVPLVQVVP